MITRLDFFDTVGNEQVAKAFAIWTGTLPNRPGYVINAQCGGKRAEIDSRYWDWLIVQWEKLPPSVQQLLVRPFIAYESGMINEVERLADYGTPCDLCKDIGGVFAMHPQMGRVRQLAGSPCIQWEAGTPRHLCDYCLTDTEACLGVFPTAESALRLWEGE